MKRKKTKYNMQKRENSARLCCSVSLAVWSAFYVIPPLMTTSISLYYSVGRKRRGAPGTSMYHVYSLAKQHIWKSIIPNIREEHKTHGRW